MRHSKYAVLVFLFFCFQTAVSQTFTVTSKEDSGPGTLREALTIAASNGTVTKDVIKFNLPGSGLGSNIIRLRSQLPVVTSNVTIDGSTQAGQPLGVSGAKVIIEPELPLYSGFSCLVIGTNPFTGSNYVNYQTTDVEIYGLYIRKFAVLTNLQTVNTGAQISGIIIDYRVDKIKIGAAGKGNVIGGNTYGILLRNNSNTSDLLNKQDNISIQGNLIGITDDGFTDESNYIGISGDISHSVLTIGGDAQEDGNVIAANGTDISITRGYSTALPMLLNIFGNKVGTDFAGKKHYKNIPLFSGSSTVQMNGIRINASNTTANISKNIISGHLTTGLSITNSEFLITNNQIGTGISGTETNLGNGSGIKIEGNATGTIGGSADTDPNFIGYNTFGIESFSSRAVKITHNSIFCNTQLGIGKVTTAVQAYIQVLKINPAYITGKASPGAEIELFYTDDCPGLCQGKTYIKTERAGADGRWKYEGVVNGKITATASIPNGVTSQFSTAGLLPDEAILDPVTCKGLGSVTISEPREGITFKWYKLEADGTAGYITDTQSIDNLNVGNYEVRIGDGCSEVAHRFPITDQVMTELIITTPQPQCGQTSFNFTASIFRGKGVISFVWENALGEIVGYGNSVNLPQGTYTVTARDEANCIKTYTFQEIKRKPSPVVKNTMPTTPAACGQKNGAITGIEVTDATNPKFKWYTYDISTNRAGTTVVSEEQVLKDVYGGYYILVVSDDGGCPPVTTSPIYIGIYDSVVIEGGSTVNSTCNDSNGAINNIYITEGDKYRLTSNGLPVKEGVCTPGVLFNITGLAAGTYTLYASNSITLCEATSRNFFVTATPIVQYLARVTSRFDASCDQNNGAITLSYSNNLKPMEGRYQWENAVGEVFQGTSEKIENLTDGTYTLRITDPNGCTSDPLGPYIIERIQLLIVDKLSGFSVDDPCGLGRGSIAGVKITGGSPLSGEGDGAVYKYAWKDVNGGIAGTSKDLSDVGAGDYYLEVTDQTTCGLDRSKVFTIAAPIIPLSVPVVNNMRVCYVTEIMLPIMAPEEGIYQMYQEEDDSFPLMETKNGRFIFNVSKTSDYYIRRKLGTCYSEFTAFHIEVTNDNLEIKNTMTPNGDGMNDFWLINGLPDHGDINIKLYTRSGQLVYESAGKYDKPFDGRFRGKDLPAGVYYYKIDLRADCDPIGGSLTLLR